MKRFILFTLLLGSTWLCADASSQATTKEDTFARYLTTAVKSVESARKDALNALDEMVKHIDLNNADDNTSYTSISTQIVQTDAVAKMARNTAKVEIAKAKAIAEISKAVDAVEMAKPEEKKTVKDASLQTIIQAIADVEIAKAQASKNIAKATQRVEISKNIPKTLPHPQEALSIAKNLSKIQIAKSVSAVEVAQAQSYIEIAKSSMKNLTPELSKKNKEKVEKMKAEATAKISSYLTELEVLKAEIEAKIAKEVAKVEVAQTGLRKTQTTK